MSDFTTNCYCDVMANPDECRQAGKCVMRADLCSACEGVGMVAKNDPPPLRSRSYHPCEKCGGKGWVNLTHI